MSLENLHTALATALTEKGYETLTPVQLLMLEPANAGADLLVSAQTGSGKTVAFGMAIASSILGDAARFDTPGLPLGLVIAPTRELALQVRRELDWLYAGAGVVTASAVGGMDQRTERRALERGAHIVVGTPGRLRDHITRRGLDLSAIRAVVLDEADEMLDLGFREDLEFILAAAPEERRTLMFSATVPAAIAKLAQTFQRDAVRVTATAASERHADIEYQVMLVQKDEREHAVINALLFFDSTNTIVFCHTREAVKHLAARLANRGFAVVALSGELTQAERTNALQAMRDGRARVCVATDVAARGIDLPNLDLVIHADVPSNPDTLLHRSGRTGRAGRKGICVLVVPAYRRNAVNRVLAAANLRATTRTAPSISDIEARQHARIIETALATPAADETEAALVAELVEKLSPEQLAAAFVRQQRAVHPVGEELANTVIPADNGKVPARREKRFEDEGVRAPDLTDSVWFSLSLGRQHRADPKWLLPLICKAGDLTKRDIGSIKIFDTDTKFEISADKAAAFAAAVAIPGALEKGATITRVGEKLTSSGKPFSRPRSGPKPEYNSDRPKKQWGADKPYADKPKKTWEPRPAAAEQSDQPKKKWQPSLDPAPASPKPDREPHFKVRSDTGEKLGTQPAAATEKPRKPKEKNRSKDKGKPKYKNRPNANQHAGDVPRVKSKKLPQD
jgi:ATP-dependent RNA helicase DeaD